MVEKFVYTTKIGDIMKFVYPYKLEQNANFVYIKLSEIVEEGWIIQIKN